MWQGILPAHGLMPAASPKALTAISRTIRRWTLHQRTDKSLQDLANLYNPYIGGWLVFCSCLLTGAPSLGSSCVRAFRSRTFP